nr:hypothetical protein CFP56_70107 [Quercus suber]
MSVMPPELWETSGFQARQGVRFYVRSNVGFHVRAISIAVTTPYHPRRSDFTNYTKTRFPFSLVEVSSTTGVISNKITMSEKLVLFDNPSRFGSGTTWSPNVWKCSGIEPHKPGTALSPYTIPVVRFPDGRYIMESRQIADEIEKLYPEPSAHIDDPVHARVQSAWRGVMMILQAVLVPRMPRECLSGPTIQFHRSSRSITYGMGLEEYEAQSGGEPCWQAAAPRLKALADILNENQEGPFCLGKTPSYPDFLVAGFLEWCRVLGGDCLQRVYNVDPAFEQLFTACAPWLARNDH